MPPFDGNGNYSLPTNSFAQPVTGTAISDPDAITLWADFTTAFSTCVVNNQTVSPSLLNPKILTKILDTNSNEVLEFGPTGSAVNHLKLINAATGNVPTIQTAGEADTGIDIENSEGEELLQLGATATAVNNLKITNAATGNPPTVSTEGEADIGIDFENSEGEELLKIGATATAVNEVTITNSATGNAVTVAATGDDTNIDLGLVPKGTGGVYGALKMSTKQSLNGESSVDFDDVPSWCKRITIIWESLSPDSSSATLMRLKVAGTPDTSGTYHESEANFINSTLPTVQGSTSASSWSNFDPSSGSSLGFNDCHGRMTLINIGGNDWVQEGNVGSSNGTYECHKVFTGFKSLSGTLTGWTWFLAAGAYDAGSVNAIYEG